VKGKEEKGRGREEREEGKGREGGAKRREGGKGDGKRGMDGKMGVERLSRIFGR